MIYGQKSIYKLSDAITWALNRTLGVEDWEAKRKAEKPRGRPLRECRLRPRAREKRNVPARGWARRAVLAVNLGKYLGANDWYLQK
jgi:hypothetical protein